MRSLVIVFSPYDATPSSTHDTQLCIGVPCVTAARSSRATMCMTRHALWGVSMQVEVLLDGHSVAIERTVFVSLLENSVANSRAAFQHALEDGFIKFTRLVELARTADIPYSLFFAPEAVVEAQLVLKTEKLLQGLTKQAFSLNSRNAVELRDIELIV